MSNPNAPSLWGPAFTATWCFFLWLGLSAAYASDIGPTGPRIAVVLFGTLAAFFAFAWGLSVGKREGERSSGRGSKGGDL